MVLAATAGNELQCSGLQDRAGPPTGTVATSPRDGLSLAPQRWGRFFLAIRSRRRRKTPSGIASGRGKVRWTDAREERQSDRNNRIRSER